MANLGELVADLRVNTAPLRQAENEMRKFGNTAKNATEKFNNDLLKLGRTLASFAAVFYTVKNALRVFGVGIEFQKTIEDTGLSLTGLVASLYDYKDATGKTLEGVDAFAAAHEDVLKIQNEMRVAGLKTAATYQELMEAMQQAFAPAKEAGVALGEMVPFVQRLTQVAQVAGVPMHMLNEEIRSFTTGAMTRRTTRIMPFMESIGLTNQKVRELIKSGKLFEELMTRTSQISILAGKSVNTWTVSLSNLYDAFQNIMGVGLESTFGLLKTQFQVLTDAIVKIDEKTGAIEFNPTFLSAIRSIDRSMHNALTAIEKTAKAIASFQQAHPVLTEILTDFGGIVVKVAALGVILKLLSGSFGLIKGAVIGGLGLIPNMLKSIGSRIGWVIELIAAVARWLTMLVIPSALIGSIVGIGVAIAAVVAGLVLFHDEINTAASYLWNFVKDWEVLGYTIEEMVELAILNLAKIGTYVGVDLLRIIEGLKYVWNNLGKVLTDTWNDIWRNMPDAVKEACEVISGIFYSLIMGLVDYAKNNPITLEMIVKAQETTLGAVGPGVAPPAAGFEDPFAEHVIEGMKAAKKSAQELAPKRDEIQKQIDEVYEKKFWGREYTEYSYGHPDKKKYALQMLELYKKRGIQPPAYLEEWLKPAGIGKKKAPEAAGGGGKGGADKAGQAAQRLYDMTLRWKEQIDELVGTGLGKLDSWYNKEINNIIKLEEKGAAGTEEALKARETLKELYSAKYEEIERDYHSWVASAMQDEVAQIENEQKELLRKYQGFKDAEINIERWAEREKALVRLQKQSEVLELFQQQLQNVGQQLPFQKQQLEWSEKLLPVQQKIADLALKRQIIEKGIPPELAAQLMGLQALTFQMQKMNMEREKWKYQGAMGGMREWGFGRKEEEETRASRGMIEIMESLESTTAEAVGGAVVGALRGKQTDISEVFFSAAEEAFTRATDMLVAMAFDQIAKVFRAPLEQAPMIGASTAAATNLTTAGTILSEQMISGAYTASSILSSTVIPGLGGGGLPIGGGGLPKLLGGGIGFGAGGGLGGGLDVSDFAKVEKISFGGLKTAAEGFYKNQSDFYGDLTGQSGNWFNSLFNGVDGFFNKMVKGFSKDGEEVTGGLFKKLFDALKSFFGNITSLFGLGGAGGGGGGGLGFGVGGGALGLGAGGGGGFSLGGIFSGIGGFFKNIFGGLGGLFGFQHGGYVTKPTLAMIGEGGPEYVIPEGMFKGFFSSLTGLFKGLFGGFFSTIGGLFSNLVGLLTNMGTGLGGGLFKSIGAGIGGGGFGFGKGGGVEGGFIGGGLGGAEGGFIGEGPGLGFGISPLQQDLMGGVTKFYDDQVGFFNGLSGQTGGWFNQLFGVIGGFFKSLFGGFGGAGGGGGGGGPLGGLFGGLFKGLGGILGAILPFQEGGYVRKPTLGLIGEAGPEYVIPEKKMKEILSINHGKTVEELSNKKFSENIVNSLSQENEKNKFSSHKQFIKELPGFQKGGEFIVKGAGGADSQVISFKATPGEKVSITPPGKTVSEKFLETNFRDFIGRYDSKSEFFQEINREIEDTKKTEHFTPGMIGAGDKTSPFNIVRSKSGEKGGIMELPDFKTGIIGKSKAPFNLFQSSRETVNNQAIHNQLGGTNSTPFNLVRSSRGGNFTEINSFASGGFVTKPTLAMLGEREPELVIPESKMGQYVQSFDQSRDQRHEQEITINTPIYINAPDPSRFYASREQLESRRASELRRALRNL